MIRIVHLVRIKSQFSIFLQKILKIGVGFERILYLLITYFILQHVTACLWYDDTAYNYLKMNIGFSSAVTTIIAPPVG